MERYVIVYVLHFPITSRDAPYPICLHTIYKAQFENPPLEELPAELAKQVTQGTWSLDDDFANDSAPSAGGPAHEANHDAAANVDGPSVAGTPKGPTVPFQPGGEGAAAAEAEKEKLLLSERSGVAPNASHLLEPFEPGGAAVLDAMLSGKINRSSELLQQDADQMQSDEILRRNQSLQLLLQWVSPHHRSH